MNLSKIDTYCYNISNYKNLIRRVLLSVLFAIHFCDLVAQPVSKPPVGSANYGNWPYVNWPSITNDGTYAMYTLHSDTQRRNHQVVCSTRGSWQQYIGADTATGFFFSADNHWLIYRSDRDSSLYRLRLGSQEPAIVIAAPIHSFKASANNRWLAYRLNDAKNTLLLEDLVSGRRRIFTSVRDYYFSPAGNYLLMATEEKVSGLAVKRLSLTVVSREAEIIWTSHEPAAKPIIEHTAYGPGERQLAFFVQYKDSAMLFLTTTEGRLQSLAVEVMPEGFSLAAQGTPIFNRDGTCLFLYLCKRLPQQQKKNEASDLDIWHYRDEWVPGQQLTEEKSHYLAVFHVNTGRLCLLETANDVSISLGGSSGILPIGRYVFATQERYLIEFRWQPGYHNSLYLVSTENGSRQIVPKNDQQLIFDVTLSPGERFLTWYNNIDHHYYSYEIATGQTRDISIGLPFSVYDDTKTGDVALSFGSIGWFDGDDRFLIYDRFDIWGLDPTGLRPPFNLTHGYGRRKEIVLGIADDRRGLRVIASGDRLLLAGFNRRTKENGFFTLIAGKNADPIQKCLDPYTYYIPRTVPDYTGISTLYDSHTGESPLKARQVEAYIVRQMSAETSPNYFFTKDFKTFRPVSEVYPERDYNWLRSELVNWKLPDGRSSKGILYKPENFDPAKKYPVLFYYYREKSDGFHMYMQPHRSAAYINIPQYVSNEYLVFVPDISPQQGSPGQSALEAVESAARYLIGFSWVDAARLGIMGQSYGGYETNYIVTHSQMFAAACSGSGPSNLISGYGTLFGLSHGHRLYETGQINLGTSLGNRPDLYIANSPVLKVRDVTTPLLIWQGGKDKAVVAGQAIEMYLNLRREDKKVWLLMYNSEEHCTTGKNAEDLDIRMRQFFDHYLKNAPAPQWMTQGRPTRLKGIDERLAPDISGAQP